MGNEFKRSKGKCRIDCSSSILHFKSVRKNVQEIGLASLPLFTICPLFYVRAYYSLAGGHPDPEEQEVI